MPPSLSIVHRVTIPAPATHMVHVETTVSAAGGALPDAITLLMPVWTPGSYLVREYARHVEGFETVPAGRARKIRKNAWRLETGGLTSVAVRYRVYAAELTVRTSHVDDRHAFLVPAAVFLGLEGGAEQGAIVEIAPPPGWEVTTPLPRVGAAPDGALRFEARDFDTLVDSPIEMGTHRELPFAVLGVPHRYVVVPPVPEGDLGRLVDDTRAIIETEAKLFGGTLPYPAYDILLHWSPRNRGGLEHRSSATLIAPPTSFGTREAYLDLLSLVAHELFHAWNVKRIRPAGLAPYVYDGESYTRLLWWFEGATSYYDWRVLVLAKLCSVEEYLDHLAGEIAYLEQTQGRLVQSLEDASYDAWIKLYRPDENSANSGVSYYRKGEIVCALLDVEIRARSGRTASLDAVAKLLWDEYGARERPVPEDAMPSIFESVAKTSLRDLFDAWIRTPAEVDCAATLAHVGLSIERSPRPDAPPCSLGARTRADGGRVVVASVVRGGAAWRAGIDAGDEIIAIGGARLEPGALDAALRGRAPGQRVDVIVARDGRMLTKTANLDPAPLDRLRIVPAQGAAAAERELFANWLGQPALPPAAPKRGGA